MLGNQIVWQKSSWEVELALPGLFLAARRAEVMSTSIFEYDREAHLRQVAEEKMAEGYREGKIAGILDILAELGSVPDDVIRRIQSEKTFQY